MVTKEFRGSVQDDQLYSQHLKQNVPLIVYLPHNYSSLYTYPVLFLQDGQDYFSLGKIATTLDTMIAEKLLERCIVIGVPVESKRERIVLYRPKGSKHDSYKRFFAEELVPYIDSKYATNPMSGARALMGSSLGATVSFEIALTYPNTFHYVISQSGAYYEGTKERIENYAHSVALLSIYQIIGTEETNVETSVGELDLLQLNRELRDAILKKGIPLHYEEYIGDHTWGYWQEDIPKALSFIWGK